MKSFVLFIAASVAVGAAEFSTGKSCASLWGPISAAMMRAGFQPTNATNRNAGMLVFEFRNGIQQGYINRNNVTRYTTERPGALTSYQAFGMQQASMVLNKDGAGCLITMTVDILAYKSSMFQTGWFKLISTGNIERELLAPVLQTTEPELTNPEPDQIKDASKEEASKKLLLWLTSQTEDPLERQFKIGLAKRLNLTNMLPAQEKPVPVP